MILCIDCGNSRLKWGVRDGDVWLSTGALPHENIAQLVTQLPANCVVENVIGCNVAGDERAREIASVLKRKVDWIASTHVQCGVTNGYDTPAMLGTDRWAALVAARALHHDASLVVLAGTATTIDALDHEGRHLGGLILPGIRMMMNALASGTAQLPNAQGQYQPWPHNTHDAIVSGAMQATLGAIQRMATTTPALQDAICLLSGGTAEILQPYLGTRCRRIDTLVLDGLACIAAVQRPDRS
jgi:type III pantothenate kinase